jgi:hypothetical protein
MHHRLAIAPGAVPNRPLIARLIRLGPDDGHLFHTMAKALERAAGADWPIQDHDARDLAVFLLRVTVEGLGPAQCGVAGLGADHGGVATSGGARTTGI